MNYNNSSNGLQILYLFSDHRFKNLSGFAILFKIVGCDLLRSVFVYADYLRVTGGQVFGP